MIISIRLITIAIVAYFPDMFLINVFVPDCNAQMPNINANENVNNTELNPITNPDIRVTAINVAIVLVECDVIQLVMPFNHFDFGVNVGFFWDDVFSMYPGVHNAAKPKGILQMIFHVGIFKSRMRQNLA